MFTGIIESLGYITKIEAMSQGLRFFISSNIDSLRIGDSIAVNGVCFTVTRLGESNFCFEASPETLAKTTMACVKIGDLMHLEVPLSLSKPLGGHFVTGHVDETLRISMIEPLNEFSRYVIDGITKPQWICDKGSITLDGVSLTINRVISEKSIECMLIPHTISQTRFNTLKVNDLINAEYDYLAKIVARQSALATKASQVSYCEEM